MKKNLKVIKESVESAGGKIESLKTKRDCWRIDYKNKTFYIEGKFRIFKTVLDTTFLAKFKDLTCEIFKREGFSYPKTLVVNESHSNKEIMEMLKNIQPPFVLKDVAGSLSLGVFTNISSKKKALDILQRELKNYKKMLIQETVSGKEYRVLVLEDKVLGVLQMIPPYVIGDGKKSVLFLIEEKQKRTKNKILQEDNLIKLLEDQKESLESIPEKGKKVFLKGRSCLAEGGETIDMTDKINSQIVAECTRLASACGLALAGIDLFCDDIALPIEKQNFYFIEINSSPDLYMHYCPNFGKPRDVVRMILDYIVKNL